MKKKLRKEKKIRKDLEKKNSENKALISFYESSPSVTSFTCNSVSTPGLTYFILEPVITEPTQNMNEFKTRPRVSVSRDQDETGTRP